MIPLVLLHAFPLDRRMWEAQAAALDDVVALDLCTEGGPAIDAVADQVVADARARGHERFVLGGLSMGGYVALAVARRHPEVLAGLILADTKAAADTDAAREKRFAQIAEIEANGLDALAGSFPQAVTAPDADPALIARLAGWIREQRPASVVGALRMLAARPDATAGLGAIAVPTLVIVGEADATTPPAEAEKLAAGIAGAQLVRIPGAGHLASLEAPQAFNAALAGFMRVWR